MQRQQLFIQYLHELEQYLPEQPHSLQEEIDYFQTLRTHPNLIWVDITNETELIGFVVIDSAPPHADWHIVETFIAPAYRRKQYMSSALQAFLAAHPGTYSLYILNRNEVAKQFWNSFFVKSNYVLRDDSLRDTCGKLYVFAPASNNNMS